MIDRSFNHIWWKRGLLLTIQHKKLKPSFPQLQFQSQLQTPLQTLHLSKSLSIRYEKVQNIMYAFGVEENSIDTKMALSFGNVVTVHISTICHNSSFVIKGINQG